MSGPSAHNDEACAAQGQYQHGSLTCLKLGDLQQRTALAIRLPTRTHVTADMGNGHPKRGVIGPDATTIGHSIQHSWQASIVHWDSVHRQGPAQCQNIQAVQRVPTHRCPRLWTQHKTRNPCT